MPGKNREKDQRMSSALKVAGEERTSQQCPVCYKQIPCDSVKSKYTHKCGMSKGE